MIIFVFLVVVCICNFSLSFIFLWRCAALTSGILKSENFESNLLLGKSDAPQKLPELVFPKWCTHKMYETQFIISSFETTEQNFHISSSVSLLLYQVSDLKTQINHEALQPSYHDRCSNLLLVRGFMLYIVILVILKFVKQNRINITPN